MATDSELPPSHSSPKHRSQTLELENQLISPNNSPKTPTLASPPPSSSSSKGKSKIEDVSMADSDSTTSCGICLSEEGKAVRGWIDSCDHFFCFVCIMEWSKVESRCPMCKRRFSSIRRPPMDGIFLSERIVSVPVRDQVYHYSGNSTMGPRDPYSEVKCSVCHSSQDENLLLLCDLCDSAAHSFCVGLGPTVPEGDWFCRDCTILKDEHAKNETKPEEHVSIIDVVRESKLNSVSRPIMIPLDRTWWSTPIVPDGEVRVTDIGSQRASGTELAEPTATQSSARTLKRCRNVQGRIHVLRENWNAFRSGSMSFPSSLVARPNTGAVVSCGGSSQPHLSSSSSQQLTAQKSSSSITLHERSTQGRSTKDIDKAWRMLNAAKSIGKGCVRTSIVRSASKHSSREVNAVKDANMSTKLIASSSKKHASEDHLFFGSEKRSSYFSLEKQKQSGVSVKGVPNLIKGSQSSYPQVYCELPSSKDDSVQVDISHGNLRDPPKGSSVGAMSNISCANQEFNASCQAQHKKCRTENSCGDSKASTTDNAKSEIQSLVKLNLKLLTRDKKLEVDVFKEVARLSTHSILAACGLERPKRGVRSFMSSVCCHVSEARWCRNIQSQI